MLVDVARGRRGPQPVAYHDGEGARGRRAALALEAHLPQLRAPKPRRRPRGRPTAGGGHWHARRAKVLNVTVPQAAH